MYSHIINRTVVGLGILVLLEASFTSAAQAQLPIDYGNVSPSRKFFNEGNKLIDREIKSQERDEELLKINLPQNNSFFHSPSFQTLDDRFQPEIEPGSISETAIDSRL